MADWRTADRTCPPGDRRTVRRRSLTWLGVAVVAAILVATLLATVAAIHDARHEASDRRATIAAPALNGLADDVERTAASLADLRAFFESSDDVTPADFTRFTASSLSRQESLDTLAWMPLSGEGLVSPPGSGAVVPAALADAAGGAVLDEARDTAKPRMTAPVATAEAGRVAAMVQRLVMARCRVLYQRQLVSKNSAVTL